MKTKIVFLLLAIVAIAGCSPTPIDASLRHTNNGDVIGFEDQSNTYAWKGIPFAQPPVGDLRWRAPRPAANWNGVKSALEYGSMCSQVVFFDWLPINPVVGSEDCLYLDVWTPRLTPAEIKNSKLPVMVYIHGGANTVGMSGAIRHYRLAGEENVIVVALQYRLGLLGWFSHPAVRSQAETELDGTSNFALLDMMAALGWVQNNIEAFGGDAQNVTVFGESAGGFNVYALLASPKAKGLFQRAIVQSGNVSTVPRDMAENYSDDEQPGFSYSSREYINRLLQQDESAATRSEAKALQDSMSDAELMAYLRAKPQGELFDGVTLRPMLGYKTYSNVRDGLVLPHTPVLELFSDPKNYNSVPVMVGSNKDEYKFFLWRQSRFTGDYNGFFADMLGKDYPEIKDLADYNRITGYFSDQWGSTAVSEPAAVLSQSQPGSVFAYRLDWARQKTQGDVDMAELFGAAHGNDTVFLFGPDAVSTLPNYAQAIDETDYDELGDGMRANRADLPPTASPGRGSNNALPEWMPWQADGEKLMLLDLPGKGLGMTKDALMVAELKQRLQNDPLVSSTQQRCELYAQLFWYALSKEFFDKDEYHALGCDKYPLASFDGII